MKTFIGTAFLLPAIAAAVAAPTCASDGTAPLDTFDFSFHKAGNDNPLSIRIITRPMINDVCTYNVISEGQALFLSDPPQYTAAVDSDNTAIVFQERDRLQLSSPFEVDILTKAAAASSFAADDNFCGTTWAAADSGKCGAGATPCPLGTNDECPSGETCYKLDCSTPSSASGSATTTTSGGSSSNYCGATWAEADARKCGAGATHCPLGTNSECPNGETCFKLTCGTADVPFSASNPVLNWCGVDYEGADAGKCYGGAVACPSGTDSDCPSGQACFKFDSCGDGNNWCGDGWVSANEGKCGTGAVACPLGVDSECPNGQGCFTFDCSASGNSRRSLSVVARDLAMTETYSASGDSGSWVGQISSGTYNTYLLHGSFASSTGIYSGKLRFPGQEIVGILYTSSALGASDATLGNDGVLYPKAIVSSNRGWELSPSDQVSITSSCEGLSVATCPISDCEASLDLGTMTSAAGGPNAYRNPYPNTDPNVQLKRPNGRDDNVGFLVKGNYKAIYAAEVEGRMVILGDMIIEANGVNSLVFAGYGSGIIPSDGSNFIQVGGNIRVDRTVGVMRNQAGGAIVYGGTLSGSGRLVGGSQGSLEHKPDIDLSEFTELFTYLTMKSEGWAKLAPNGIFVPSGNGNTATFKAGADDACIQVFSVDAADLRPNWGINVKFDASLTGKTILINVNAPPSGVVVVDKLSSFVDPDGNGNYAFSSAMTQSILWNFHDATELKLGICGTGQSCANGEFHGSVLAPNAAKTTMQMPGQSGRFIAGGDVIHDFIGSEFHNFPFNPPCSLPAPPGVDEPKECQSTPAPLSIYRSESTMSPSESPCPQVEHWKTFGETMWEGDDLPITIVSQDSTTVTFTVSNTWKSSISYLYTEFDEAATNGGSFNDHVCYTEEDFAVAATDSFTAHCYSNKFAVVTIFASDGSFNAQTDTATVPKCCHPPETDTYPKVKYMFKLRCDSACPSDDGVPTEERRFLRGNNNTE